MKVGTCVVDTVPQKRYGYIKEMGTPDHRGHYVVTVSWHKRVGDRWEYATTEEGGHLVKEASVEELSAMEM